MWEPLQEETSASEPQSLGSIEGTIPAAAVWTSEPTLIEMASAEGSSEGDLDTPAGDGGPRVMPSQALAGGPPRAPNRGVFRKEHFSGREELLWDPDSSLIGAVPAYAGDPCSMEKEAPEEREL